ncbi:serum paraoxonase/arylesterase family protein [Aspergillus heteromorphus CBS 117.55]|uniref:Serum paraoxonase/arylesterase family protein n=1 Tax=Aspergillus heteromorphus CBS 117.55 TaxID=1448321 RepID=A0A317V425_9EURO|nr:serum paraoxonase/arylesterase family protein [Aspergillus heteromorphus CBS 117.55]PWY67552.1 serum paraoxonase/arylesterase family protein [Aspergillus heteromorphus CBS 117.55]
MGGHYINLSIIAILVSTLYGPISHELTVLGVFRTASSAVNSHGQDRRPIHAVEDTLHCEDLHYYPPADQIFTACEDSALSRFKWFPPLANFDGEADTTGSIHVIDPRTLISSRLAFENFSGPFVTHGIDLIPDPEREDAVYIFAVNHLGNPEHETGNVPRARSQIELFHHVLQSGNARHVRSIRHPLITTPNDIYAASPRSFYVTNDHHSREGYKRMAEDLLPVAKWSNVIHVQLDRLPGISAEGGVDAVVAADGLRNPNGLGHGQSEDEVLLTSAIGGILYRARPNPLNRTVTVLDHFAFDSTIDNPSYYRDPYRTSDDDASGYILGGLLRAVDVAQTHNQPHAKEGVMVWHLRRSPTATTRDADRDSDSGWEKRLIFEDDGTHIRTASTALLLPIQSEESSKSTSEKKARLFVTGFVSEAVIAVEVSL